MGKYYALFNKDYKQPNSSQDNGYFDDLPKPKNRLSREIGPKDIKKFEEPIARELHSFYKFLKIDLSFSKTISPPEEMKLIYTLQNGLDTLSNYINKKKNLLLESDFSGCMTLLFGKRHLDYNIDIISLEKISLLNQFLAGEIDQEQYRTKISEIQTLENHIHTLIAYAAGVPAELNEKESHNFKEFLKKEFNVKQIHINPKKIRQSYAIILAYYLKKNSIFLTDKQINTIFNDLNMTKLILNRDLHISKLLSSGNKHNKSSRFLKTYRDFNEAQHSTSTIIRPLTKFLLTKPKSVGKGSFGEVYQFNYKKECFAVKKLIVSDLSDRNKFSLDALRVHDESKTHAILTKDNDNSNLPKHYGMFYINNELYIVTEFCHKGSLNSLLEKEKFSKYPTTLNKGVMNILSGVAHMHLKGFIHNDIAGRNILVRHNNTFALTDFGLTLDTNLGYRTEPNRTLPLRWSPKLRMLQVDSPMNDAYALAATMVEIYNRGKRPFDSYYKSFIMSQSPQKLCKILMCELEEGQPHAAILNLQKILLYSYLIEERDYAKQNQLEFQAKAINKLMLKIKSQINADELIDTLEGTEPFNRMALLDKQLNMTNLWNIKSALSGKEAHVSSTNKHKHLAPKKPKKIYVQEAITNTDTKTCSFEQSPKKPRKKKNSVTLTHSTDRYIPDLPQSITKEPKVPLFYIQHPANSLAINKAEDPLGINDYDTNYFGTPALIKHSAPEEILSESAHNAFVFFAPLVKKNAKLLRKSNSNKHLQNSFTSKNSIHNSS